VFFLKINDQPHIQLLLLNNDVRCVDTHFALDYTKKTRPKEKKRKL
jgi:hypothetical protein